MRKTIPLSISPAFFLTAAIIGFLSSFSLVGTLIWVGIIFVSVLFHEYGHALSALAFGQSPRIQLVAFGGVTIPKGPSLPLWKEFLVVLCGPLFGFLLFLGSVFVLNKGWVQSPLGIQILSGLRLVNAFWTVVNLLPVLPLDGGQLLRIVIEGIFGVKGRRAALVISMVLSLAFAFLTTFYGIYIIAVLFFLFAYQNFEMFRYTHGLSEADGQTHLKQEIAIGEHQFLSGNINDAKLHFENILHEAKEGIIHRAASEYLAQIYEKEGNKEKAYQMLMTISKKDLSDFSKCLLHKLAYDMKNYPLVSEIAGDCFQAFPSADIAQRTALACANLKESKAALGWLKTSINFGLKDAHHFMEDRAFDFLRNEREFKEIFSEKSKQ